ncbi:MAG: GTP-binding protein, partial [Lentisphaeraceae bacterium]|nr:GTP-binding protein [Lentisphaeraceae bacterium]
VNLEKHLDTNQECYRQIAFADLILMNKTDVADAQQIQHTAKLIEAVNPLCETIECVRGDIDISRLLDIGANEKSDRRLNNIKPTSVHHEHHHGHDHKAPIASLSVELPGAINHPLFRYWLSTLLFDHSDHIYRMKGIVNIADRDEKLIFQAVHRLFEDRPGPCWQDGEKRVSRMVFIGENIDRDFIVEGFKGCLEKEDK